MLGQSPHHTVYVYSGSWGDCNNALAVTSSIIIGKIPSVFQMKAKGRQRNPRFQKKEAPYNNYRVPLSIFLKKGTRRRRRRTFWSCARLHHGRLHVDDEPRPQRAGYTSFGAKLPYSRFNLVKRRRRRRGKKIRRREKDYILTFFFRFLSFSPSSFLPFFESENVVRGARNTSREIRARHSGTQSIDVRP